MQQFQVRRDNYAEQRIVTGGTGSEGTAATALAEGCINASIERFAFTANNITYAVAGDLLGYWQFFAPLANEGQSSDGWGVIPVWGFAEVTESKVEGIEPGERFFGYWPPADSIVMQPSKVSAAGFVENSEHRRELPPAYNAYRRALPAGQSDQRADSEQMLLFPLFLTGFLIAEQLQDANWYGAEQIIVLSASSKTSMGTAYALREYAGLPELIGMTSSGNRDFVEGLGVYAKTTAYDELDALDVNVPTTIVDMAGNTALLGKLHQRLGDNMRQTINVGITHWEARAAEAEGVISERSEMFFAPSRMIKLSKDWGAEGFQEKTNRFVMEAALRCRDWLKLREVHGLAGLQAEYSAILNGQADPAEGLIVCNKPA